MTGTAVGVAAAFARPVLAKVPAPLAAVVLGALAMAGSDGPLAALGLASGTKSSKLARLLSDQAPWGGSCVLEPGRHAGQDGRGGGPGGFEAFFEGLAAAAATGDARQIQQRRASLAARHGLDYLTELVPVLKTKHGLKLIGE